MRRTTKLFFACLLASSVIWCGCQTAYFTAAEKIGYDKRDLLVARVEEGRDAQEEAKDQFKTALQHFTEVVAFDGGELQAKYEELRLQLDASEEKASRVRSRINAIENVGGALLREWESELAEYSNETLRDASQRTMQETELRFEQLVSVMRNAESKMEPVLVAFRDQVLFLKHNLNAQAVASLQNEVRNIESDIALLIGEMDEAIAEADAFIRELGG